MQALTHQGQYRVHAAQVDIALREFRYPYRREPARTIRVTFRRNNVERSVICEVTRRLAPSTWSRNWSVSFYAEREKRQLVKIGDIPRTSSMRSSPLKIAALRPSRRRLARYPARPLSQCAGWRRDRRGSTLTQQLVKISF